MAMVWNYSKAKKRSLNGTKADPMGGAKRSEGYKGRMARGRMLRERDEFMLRLGDPTPPPPPPAPDPVVEQATNSEWMEEYLHWWGDPEEIEWEKFQKDQEMADRLFPDHRQWWGGSDPFQFPLYEYELPWPEYINTPYSDDYELDEEERIEWTEWYKETPAW